MPQHRRFRKDYPAGVLAIYDNGGLSIDRYTVVYEPETLDGQPSFPLVTMSGLPFHPQGFCQHGELGSRPVRATASGYRETTIAFDALPEDCQQVVRRDLEATP